MASQVTVIDPTLRRIVIKINPGTYLSQVRDQACEKFRLDPGQYSLRLAPS
jgi:tether containing UBX domain for GLUT4